MKFTATSAKRPTTMPEYTEAEHSAFHAGYSQARETVTEEFPDVDLPRVFDHHIHDEFIRWLTTTGGKR